MYGRQIGTKWPILHAKQDQVCPMCFGDDGGTDWRQSNLPRYLHRSMHRSHALQQPSHH
jgi:hypothetical protein